jgi:hypothetical protein
MQLGLKLLKYKQGELVPQIEVRIGIVEVIVPGCGLIFV